MATIISYNQLNKAVSDWATETLKKVKSRGSEMGIRHRANSRSKSDSLQGLKVGVKRRNGLPTRISFGFPKHMAYVHYGVGKYRGVGSGNEHPKPIFDVVNQELPKLRDAAAEAGLDIAMRGIFGGFIQ
ncbi:MAG: hypothetical protein JSS76_08420 [Bacteroidetes bacterium]|nr:hypothetical protein [Bacteroidota bacterium]